MEPITPQALAGWAAHDPFPPYGFYADFDDARCRAYRARQLEAMGARADHVARLVSVSAGGGVATSAAGATPPVAGAVPVAAGEAVFGLTTLGWDSDQFGVPAGRLDYLIVAPEAGRPARPDPQDTAANRRTYEVAVQVARAAVAEADRLGIRHLSARVDSRELPVLQALEANGFQLVDAILRFSLEARDFGGVGALPPGVALRDAVPSDIEPLAALAARGFLYDRFHNDPLLAPGVADRVHAAWLTNAVNGKAGDGVLVADVDGRPAGFFILSLDTMAGETIGTTIGTLVLITVDAALRRRGVARALSLGSVAWLAERGATRFEVGTQLANVPAANVYLKSGFRLVQTSVSLRRMAP